MATVKLNGQTSPSNMLCFSDSINIVEYSDTVTGTNAQIQINFTNAETSTTADSQYYITILDETITSVKEVANATNKRFYVGDSASTAYYVARALRNCDSLNADWNIINDGAYVRLDAKTIGRKITLSDISTNFSSAAMSMSDGSSTSMFGGKVNLTVSGSPLDIVTLEKNMSADKVDFNVSPVISSIAEYGKVKPFILNFGVVNNSGVYSRLLNGSMNYATYGYIANQSEPYLPISDYILLNNKRGADIITLYTYTNEIPLTLLSGGSSSIKWTTYTTANWVYDSGTTSVSFPNGKMVDKVVTFPLIPQVYYVDIEFGTQKVRFNVIKPLKMANENTRVYWRNEYGGISFFDFTGSRSESDSINIETYTKNFYDFYSNADTFEYKVPYKNEIVKEVKVTSHLMNANGRYISNSLIRSKRLWTMVNGKMHYIIPKSVEVIENENYDDIYTMTFTYEYSQLS